MKIYVAHSSSFDYANELYKPLRESDLNNQHEIALPHEISTDQFDSETYLKTCDLVIAEVSYPSTGQGIELGWAAYLKVPILCIYKSGTKPSGALKVVTSDFIEYSDSSDMIAKLIDFLNK